MSDHVSGRRAHRALAAVAAGALLSAGVLAAAPATAAPRGKPPKNDPPPAAAKVDKDRAAEHDLKNPLRVKQDALRQRALDMKLNGQADGKVVKVAKGQYVELAREDTDRVFVIIAEFGNTRHSDYCDPGQSCTYPPDGSAKTYEGPAHNVIPAPDRSVDNSTLWQADYNKAHYQDMYFNRMAGYYEDQSSGRYSVAGDVTEWVRVPFNEARYGRNYCGGIVCNNTWVLIRDAMAQWVQGQKDAGKSMAEIESYLKTFDVWDRYDFDGDGNFDESDGYIDHFQIVHAGGDEAAGDPNQGSDAIWSHRWYANLNPFGTGPTGGAPFGGTQIGQGGTDSGVEIPNNRTNVWVGDYTIQPENGGLGVFAHEYGHDLGLPDLYDTSGNTGGAENSTGFWTLMSSGANIGDGSPDGIGDAPTDMGAWEKFQLGWLGCPSCPGGRFYDVAFAGQKSEHRMGPHSSGANKQSQALFVVLPNKRVPLNLGAPCTGCGQRFFYSGSGDDLNNTMTKTSVSGGSLTAQVRYDIETDWDYAFLEASINGGTSWTPVSTNLSDTSGDQSGFNSSGTGMTGSTSGAWAALTANLPAGTNAIRFRYQTDGAVAEPGFQVDQIAVGGTTVGTAETDEGWTFTGFRTTTGSEEQQFANYYVVENRQYVNHDRSLRTAYNFGFLDSRTDWVENFPYQNGMLVNYWDTSRGDNNVGDHPGEGLILPVDAHPTFHHSYDGHLLRPRILSFDSTFGLEPTDAVTVNKNSQPTTIGSQPAVALFDDTQDWWFNADEHAATGAHVGRYEPGWVGVKAPKTGTTIRVNSVSSTGFMQLTVAPK